MSNLETVLHAYQGTMSIRQATEMEVGSLADFFSSQPEDSYTFFKPHGFDVSSLRKLVRNRAFLMFIVFDGGKIVGYFFLRCFFIGKSYLGKLVDLEYRGKGIGKMMCLTAMGVAQQLGLHMYETISRHNLASLYSTKKVLDVRILEEMDNDYIYIEDYPKRTLTD